MARWTQTWLMGPSAAGVSLRAPGEWRGRRLGLPEEGPGAVAAFAKRVVAFVVDLFVGFLVGAALQALAGVRPPTVDQVQHSEHPRAFVEPWFGYGGVALVVVVTVALTGQTFGMKLLRMRVARLDQPGRVPGLVKAVLRTALLLLLVPALISDRDGRGLHDKLAGTVVVDT